MQERKVPGLEAVVNAALSLGSDGRGKGGVGGHMAAMASKHPKRFASLLERALQLKKSEWRGGEAFLSSRRCRSSGRFAQRERASLSVAPHHHDRVRRCG